MAYNFDASSVIHFWENYPIKTKLFDALYDWFARQIAAGVFVISEVALEEVKGKSDELYKWLNGKNISVCPKNVEDIIALSNLEQDLGISGKQDYGKKGVGENDLLIIAIAKRKNHILVSNEAVQNNLPKKKNYKIPAVCKHIAAIKCIDFLQLLNDF